MACEDIIINTLMRALQAKNSEQGVNASGNESQRHHVPSRVGRGEHDLRLFETSSSIDTSPSAFDRVLSRLFGRRA
jgi:hypothetical protein